MRKGGHAAERSSPQVPAMKLSGYISPACSSSASAPVFQPRKSAGGILLPILRLGVRRDHLVHSLR